MRSERPDRWGTFSLGEDILEHPWRWEPISWQEAMSRRAWEPVVLLRSSQGMSAVAEVLDEMHPVCRVPLRSGMDGVRFFRCMESRWARSEVAGLTVEPEPRQPVAEQAIEAAERAARPTEESAPRPPEQRRLRLRLLDDARGEPLPGISLVVDMPHGQRVTIRTDAAGRIDMDAGQAARLSLSVDTPPHGGGAG